MSDHDQDANPAPDDLADERDTDGWDTGKHGRMADHATPDDTVNTMPWQPESGR